MCLKGKLFAFKCQAYAADFTPMCLGFDSLLSCISVLFMDKCWWHVVIRPWRCTQQWSLICLCYCSCASDASLMENSVSMMLLSPGNCSLFITSLLDCTGLDCVWLQFLQASWWPVNYCSCCSCSCGRLVFHFSSFFYLNRLWKLLPYWKSSGFREW